MKKSWVATISTLTLLSFLSLATLASGDTLVLRDGTSLSGVLVSADARTIEFQDDLGSLHIFEMSQIEVLRMTSSSKDNAEFPGLSSKTQKPQKGSDVIETSESELIQQLLRRVAQLEATVGEMKKPETQAQTVSPPEAAHPPVPVDARFVDARFKETVLRADSPPSVPSSTSTRPVAGVAQSVQEQGSAPREHTMAIPGFGPTLKIRGFLDFNFGLGDVANPLISPLGAPGHATFQEGEFDLFITSKLSSSFDFLGEVVIGSDATNQFGIDIERLMFQYTPNEYFQIAAGRYHTAIGYYSTAFHHGTWFQKATGRPFLFLFEDNGGILPVHSVGVTTAGLVPKTGKLNLHWVAEIGNGRKSSNPNDQPVQSFLDENDHKAFNLAFYIKPDWIPGTQFGASYYRDRLTPAGLSHINQSISSVHAVYTATNWEVLNEAVLLRHQSDGQNRVFDTPGFYSQIARRFAKNYWPYFRYQYVNVPKADLVNSSVGRQNGPSAGIRWDFTNYAGLKVQYNRLYQRGSETKNGLDTQLAFTF